MTAGEAEQACPAGKGAAQMISRARTAARDKARAADREAAKDGNEIRFKGSDLRASKLTKVDILQP